MNYKTILAFDVGLKRTGVAVGQTLTRSAEPAGLLTVQGGKFDWSQIDNLIERWDVDLIVIGDPKTSDPHLNKVINRLKSYIQQQHKLTIVDHDEAYSSASANAELQSSQLRQAERIGMRDQIAACLILQGYFEQL